MNHNVTLGIVAIVAAMTLTAVAFAIPQQALAYRHHNNHNNSIKVEQQINQLNNCTGVPVDKMDSLVGAGSSSGTVCINSGDNSADIHR
ncbi:MAG: hypothetical protein DLM72_06260 [Candidatus Nitrosopolaris wilkensis]|nr:MAG: hypothetical protein DLM72_06260 [Candidatus Nitrosopolaris wilkensis]